MKRIIITLFFILLQTCFAFSQFDIKTFDKKSNTIESRKSTMAGGYVIIPVVIQIHYLNEITNARSFIEENDSIYYVQNNISYPLDKVCGSDIAKYSEITGNLNPYKSQEQDKLNHIAEKYNLKFKINRAKLLIENLNSIWIATEDSGAYNILNDSIKRYTKENGLPTNFISDIISDQSGNIIIATNKGVCKRNNDEWIIYDRTIDKKKIRQVKNIYTIEDDILFETKKGNIGLSAKNGFRYINLPGESVFNDTLYSEYSNAANKIASGILKDINGNIWIQVGYDYYGIIRINKNKSIDFFKSKENAGSRLQASYIDKHNNFWLITQSSIGLVNSKNIKWFHLYNAEINSLIDEDTSKLWLIGKRNGGYYDYKTNQFTDLTEKYEFIKKGYWKLITSKYYYPHFSHVDFLKDTRNNYLYSQFTIVEEKTKTGNLYTSVYREHGLIILLKDNKVIDITPKLKNLDYRPLNSYLDSEGNYWIDTPTQIHKITID